MSALQPRHWQLLAALADGAPQHVFALSKMLGLKPQQINGLWQQMPPHIRGLLRQHDGQWRLVRPLAVFDETPPAWVCDGPCGVRSVMDSAQQRMEEELGRHTILDLARKMYRKAPDTFQIEVQEWISDRRSST